MKTGVKIAIGLGSLIALGGLTYYFVFRKSTTGLQEAVGGENLDEFSERFVDNDWVDGGEIAFLVANPTKFKVGDKVKVVQDKGALVPQYNGTWRVKNIVSKKKILKGAVLDAIETNCPYIKDTPPNGGLITKKL